MEVLDYEKSSRNERSTLTISPVSRRPKKLKLVSPKMKKLMEKEKAKNVLTTFEIIISGFFKKEEESQNYGV